MYRILIEIQKSNLNEDQISTLRATLSEVDLRIGKIGSDGASAIKLGFVSESSDVSAIESVLVGFPEATVSTNEAGGA